MKKTIIIFFTSVSMAFGQVTRDENGNFKAVQKTKQDTTTNYTYTDQKGAVHRVYISPKGKFYIGRVSKSGNYYRFYLKEEENH